MSKYESRIKGIVNGMESFGAIFIKESATHLFFDLPKDSRLLDPSLLCKARRVIHELCGKGLKVRKPKWSVHAAKVAT